MMMVEDDVKVEEQLQKDPKSTISTMVDQLRQIFPQRPEMELREVVESSTSIDDAIDSLLEKTARRKWEVLLVSRTETLFSYHFTLVTVDNSKT